MLDVFLARHFRWVFAVVAVLRAGRSPPGQGADSNGYAVVCREAWDRYNIKDATMPASTVKWFNATRGYGFIAPEDGSKDGFVHISAVERAGLTTLPE